VTLDALFVDPSGKDLRVPAFWAGGNLWKVRYASPLVGRHTFRTECGDTGDVGLHDIRGHVEIKTVSGRESALSARPLRVAASRRYLEHIDGTPFFWLGAHMVDGSLPSTALARRVQKTSSRSTFERF
jgi:hypothetical protein